MSTYTPIATQTIGTATSSITFSGIPQNYTDLVLVVNGKCTSANSAFLMQLGNNSIDTSTNYSFSYLYNTSALHQSNQTSGWIGDFDTTQSMSIVQIMNYSNSSTYKTYLSRNQNPNNAAAIAGLWKKTPEPVNTITINSSPSTMVAGTTFSLYGISAGNSSAKASGGNIVVTDGSYWYHAFTSSGTFIPSQALTADLLIVAGGGAGGWDLGGGGGAGGLRQLTSQSLTTAPYPVVVGAGGAMRNSSPSASGNNSIFGSISATGGGGGDRVGLPNSVGGNGGSGGGGAGAGNGGGTNSAGGSGNAGGYSPVEGYSGNAGDGYTSGMWISGGGGGSAAASNSKNGGAGTTSSLINAIASAIKIGQLSGGNYYFAGGGGGGTLGSGGGTGGSGGVGGGQEGNSGSYTMTGTPALINTGSGAGGGWNTTGNGASGIVVVRYAV